MMTTTELKQLITTKNVIFYKPSCPFSACGLGLLTYLQNTGVLHDLNVVYLDQDFTNEQLKDICTEYGWSGESEFPSKPQTFLNQRGTTEYISGNDGLHSSIWNLGEGETGEITVNGESYTAPKWTNPMDNLTRKHQI